MARVEREHDYCRGISMGRSTTIRLVGFGLAALSLGLVACAAGDDGEGSGNNNNNNGTGGLVSGDTGGGPGVPGATGGAPGATGGAPGATGGVPGAGGTAPVTVECPPAGADFATDGYASNGTLCGYIFTGSWDGATVEPPCGVGGECFTGTNTCATGSVPAEDAEAMSYPGILLGMNVQQDNMGTESTWTSTGSGLTFTFTATGAESVRAVVQVGATDYCYDGVTSGTAVPWSSFKTECWGPTGTALPAGSAIKAVLLQVPAKAMAQTPELCLTGLQVN